jgi:hypothetical protein
MEKIGAVAVGVCAVREAARAGIDGAGRSFRPEALGRAGQCHAAAALVQPGDGLVALGGPRIDEAALSGRSTLTTADNCNHMIHLDQPELVIDLVRQMHGVVSQNSIDSAQLA